MQLLCDVQIQHVYNILAPMISSSRTTFAVCRPCLHLSGTNFCTNKHLHGSTLSLYGTSRTGQIFERLSVQVWDFDWHGFVRTLVNTRTVQLFAQIARLRPVFTLCLAWLLSKNETLCYILLNLKGPSQPPPFSMTSKLLIKHGEENSYCFTVSCVPEGMLNYLE